MAERLGNIGYIALGKETTAGTAVVPTVFIPLYKETMQTIINLVDDIPVVGNKYGRYQVVQGNRDHMGSIEVMAEPDTAGYLFDMIMTRGATTGAGPYTQPYTMGVTTNTYTMDVSTGNVVTRYMGVQASKISPTWNKDEMRLSLELSALAAFVPQQIATVAGSGPYTVTLATGYDPAPTTGLVAGDLITFYHPTGNFAGTSTNATVATVTNGTVFTTTTNVTSYVAGDQVYIRPQTPSFTLLTPFLWGKTQLYFSTTAALAFTASATTSNQTRLEKGTSFEIINKFESPGGSPRSGSFDPGSLPRLVGDATFKIKQFFDTPENYNQFAQIAKSACVIRCFTGATNQYELRVTFNNLKVAKSVKPHLESDKILYSEMELLPQYDTTDAQAIAVTVINGISSF